MKNRALLQHPHMKPAQDIVRWLEKNKAEDRIADTVCDIIGDSCDPVAESCRRTADKKVRQRAERAESKPEEASNCTPEQGISLLVKEQHNDSEDTPDIEVIDPPEPEPVENSFHQYENINHKENFSAEYQGVQQNEQSNDLYIWKKC